MKSDKLIAVHNGALGDFLCAWPALLALARGAGTPGGAGPERAVAQGGKDTPRLLFAGNMERMRWLAPLGYAPCPPTMRRALDGLYGETDASAWPDALAGATVAWFCLDRAPAAAHPRVVPLPCLSPGADGGGMDGDAAGAEAPAMGTAARLNHARYASHASHASHASQIGQVGQIGQIGQVTGTLGSLLERVASSALPWPPRWDANWHGTWQTLFGGWNGAASRTVVLVPGAGHRAKQWPPRRFAAVAGALLRAGYNPLYVLGPAELERGLDRGALEPEGGEAAVVTPADHGELAHLLRCARLVIGNDSGPLHLAALHGSPVLALFGPAPAGAWRPHGAAALTSPLGCAPCSATLRTLGCGWGHGSGSPHGEKDRNATADPDETTPCMAAITVQTVLDNTFELLGIPDQEREWERQP